MVHALGEIQRVLKPGGLLLDLRPLSDSWAVEVVSSAGWEATGRLTDQTTGLEDDEAANQAVAEAEARGWFIQQKSGEFPFFYYWDTPSEMKEYLEREWDGFEKMEDDLYRKTSAVWASSNADARVRIRMKMWIATWQKK